MAVSSAPLDQSGDPPTALGTVLAGKYRVERVLGQGGMGVVVEARHLALQERVALKFLLPDSVKNAEAVERFLREARAAVKIKSEHVARVSDVGTLENGAPYMVMEFLEGQDLGQLIEKCGVLSISDAVDYLIQGCEAFAEAHSYGIVHRDIKPSNLFLTRRPDGSPLVKVLDFGISKRMDGVDNLTRTTAAMGSALYMSPEQMQQTRSVDLRTDIYALGISLFELLAGTQPFFAETLPQLCAHVLMGAPRQIREFRPDLPEHLAAIIHKAFERDRAQRFQSVAEFVSALAPYAPERSRPTIERIVRMAGADLPLPPRPSYALNTYAAGQTRPSALPQNPVELNQAPSPYPGAPIQQNTTRPFPASGYAQAAPLTAQAQTGVPAITALPPPNTFTASQHAYGNPALTNPGPYGTEPMAAMTRPSAPAPAPIPAPPPPPGFSTTSGVASEKKPALKTQKSGNPLVFVVAGSCVAALLGGALFWIFQGTRSQDPSATSPAPQVSAELSGSVAAAPAQSALNAAPTVSPSPGDSAAQAPPASSSAEVAAAAGTSSGRGLGHMLTLPQNSSTPILKTGALKANPTASPSSSGQINHGVLSKTR